MPSVTRAFEGSVKRVKDHQFLYDRGGSYYFRRAVPEGAEHAFGGKTEVVVALGTRSLAQARHLLTEQLRRYDQRLAALRGTPDPSRSHVGLHCESYADAWSPIPLCQACHLTVHRRFRQPHAWGRFQVRHCRPRLTQWFELLPATPIDLATWLLGARSSWRCQK